jgi:hypothetical protein
VYTTFDVLLFELSIVVIFKLFLIFCIAKVLWWWLLNYDKLVEADEAEAGVDRLAGDSAS